MNGISTTTRLRYNQIRLFSKAFEKLAFHRTTRSFLASIGRSTLLSHSLVGFRRTFDTFESAGRCVKRYKVPSHEHPANVAQHIHLNQTARASDYPVLFHLQEVLNRMKRVLDIGGSAGNLFYCYDRYLSYPADFTWTVFDLPRNAAAGRSLAAQRGEDRLQFVDRLEDCTNADTVLLSGSLHYFEALPPDLFRFLDPPPQHVFINRTPVIDGPSTVTIQDAGAYYAMAPARLLSRDALLSSMSAAHYDLVDEWTVPELHLSVPLHPASSAAAYSGFYFRRRDSNLSS